jgi:hypothetical protein
MSVAPRNKGRYSAKLNPTAETYMDRKKYYMKRIWKLLFPEGGVGLIPKRGCLLTLPYYAFPIWYECWERRCNDTLTEENRRTRRKTCLSATLSTTNPTWIDQSANPGLRGERPATNDLSHAMANYENLTTNNKIWRELIRLHSLYYLTS